MTLNRLPWGLRGCVLLTVEALCVSSTGGCVSGRFLLWEPALVSFSISEMGITASLSGPAWQQIILCGTIWLRKIKIYGIKICTSKIAPRAIWLSFCLNFTMSVSEIQHFFVDGELLLLNELVSLCYRTKCPWIYPTRHGFVYFYGRARYGMCPIPMLPQKAAAPRGRLVYTATPEPWRGLEPQTWLCHSPLSLGCRPGPGAAPWVLSVSSAESQLWDSERGANLLLTFISLASGSFSLWPVIHNSKPPGDYTISSRK